MEEDIRVAEEGELAHSRLAGAGAGGEGEEEEERLVLKKRMWGPRPAKVTGYLQCTLLQVIEFHINSAMYCATLLSTVQYFSIVVCTVL